MSNFITQESIDEVTSRADIISIVNEYVPLTQKGRDWWGLCPFHHEKTGSFSVSPDKKIYYCFGCHKGGSAINFIMEMEKLSYPEAIQFIAKKNGITLHYQDGYDPQKVDSNAKLKDELVNLYNRVTTSFHYMLMETEQGKFALDYITKRGITVETLKKFKLGYSPADRKWLHKFLIGKNYSEEFLAKSGLFSREYPEYAFFSDRLMFPIFDRNGNAIAMGGRFLRGNPEKSPKYLNSGDLIQYKKGLTLYAFNFAKQSIHEQKKVIFCEGYMDVIAYHQCGITYAVAPLGTALTKEQIQIVKPYVDAIYLSFDSDGAGQKATLRAILMCRQMDVTVKVIRLSGGKDPAEIMVNFGAETLTKDVNNAILDDDFLLSKLLELYSKDTPEGKKKASLEFFQYIDALQSDVQKDACMEKFCRTFEISPEAARKDYTNRNQLSKSLQRKETTEENQPAVKEKLKPTAELKAVITAVASDESLFQLMRKEISVDDLEDPLAKQMFIILEECSRSGNFSLGAILGRLENQELIAFVMNTTSIYSGLEPEVIQKSVEDSIRLLKIRALERKNLEIQNRMLHLERSSLPEDKAMLEELFTQKYDIRKQIDALKG